MLSPTERDELNEMLELFEQFECTRDQLRVKLDERESQLKSASRNAALLRLLLVIYNHHPKAPTLADAMKLVGVSIDEVLAG